MPRPPPLRRMLTLALAALVSACAPGGGRLEGGAPAAESVVVSGGDHFREETERGIELRDAEEVWRLFASRFEEAKTARFYVSTPTPDPRLALVGVRFERHVVTVNRNGLGAVDWPGRTDRRWLLVDRECEDVVHGELQVGEVDCVWMFEALLDLFRRPHRFKRRSWSWGAPDKPPLAGTIAFALQLDGGRELQLGLVNAHLQQARFVLPGVDRPLDVFVHRVETGVDVPRDLFSPRGVLPRSPQVRAGMEDFPPIL